MSLHVSPAEVKKKMSEKRKSVGFSNNEQPKRKRLIKTADLEETVAPSKAEEYKKHPEDLSNIVNPIQLDGESKVRAKTAAKPEVIFKSDLEESVAPSKAQESKKQLEDLSNIGKPSQLDGKSKVRAKPTAVSEAAAAVIKSIKFDWSSFTVKSNACPPAIGPETDRPAAKLPRFDWSSFPSMAPGR